MTKWTCYTCGAEIDTTLGALDHRIVNPEADIWPVYSDEYTEGGRYGA